MISGEEIKKEIEKGNIIIKPFNPKNINPNSYNLTLSNEMLTYKDDILDCKKNNETKKIIIPKEGYILSPGVLYIARSNEYTESDKYIPQINGRSSIGRVGITVHISGSFGTIGYKGNWTLCITCVRPTKIYPNMNICQIFYYPIVGDSNQKYDGKYQNKGEILASKSYEDFK